MDSQASSEFSINSRMDVNMDFPKLSNPAICAFSAKNSAGDLLTWVSPPPPCFLFLGILQTHTRLIRQKKKWVKVSEEDWFSCNLKTMELDFVKAFSFSCCCCHCKTPVRRPPSVPALVEWVDYGKYLTAPLSFFLVLCHVMYLHS